MWHQANGAGETFLQSHPSLAEQAPLGTRLAFPFSLILIDNISMFQAASITAAFMSYLGCKKWFRR
jgi:hypothetical protein